MDEDLTRNEEETVERDDVTGEEAHRIGEFDELRSMLSDVLDAVRGMREDVMAAVQASAAVSVGNGAVVTDGGDGSAVIDAEDFEVEDPRDRDYTIER